MKRLDLVCIGLELVEYVKQHFIEQKKKSNEFITPFICYEAKRGNRTEALEDFTEECIQIKLNAISTNPGSFVLAGDTELEDPKTGELQYFFIIKLYIKGLKDCYMYTIPFNQEGKINSLRYVGSEDNIFYKYVEPEGESSSFNAIKMDPKPPYNHRAAFLIGHMDEARLWKDTNAVVADMYCKLAPHTSESYELIFEISKFGSMTPNMKESFDLFNSYFSDEFSPKFSNIKGRVMLENTKL